jgi:hypothetical protein
MTGLNYYLFYEARTIITIYPSKLVLDTILYSYGNFVY